MDGQHFERAKQTAARDALGESELGRFCADCREVVNTTGAKAWDRHTPTAAHKRNEDPISFFASEKQFTAVCCGCGSLTEKSDSKELEESAPPCTGDRQGISLCVGVFLRNSSPARNLSLQC